MAYTMLVGLEVLDDNIYHAYRQAMMPILTRYGGDFGYDMKVADVLKAPQDSAINRVFTLCFPSREQKEAFFANQEYLKVKARYFVPSVGAATTMAEFCN